MSLSVCIICCNEEKNIGRTLSSVFEIAGEIILVDSGSSDHTLEIARGFGPKVKIFVEPSKGFARQKNSALEKASCDWVLSLAADESLSPELCDEIARVVNSPTTVTSNFGEADFNKSSNRASIDTKTAEEWKNGAPAAYRFPRRNINIGRWIKHAGYYPDFKVRLIRRGIACFDNRLTGEEPKVTAGSIGSLEGDLIHHAQHTLSDYIEQSNRRSSLDAETVADRQPCEFSLLRVLLGPAAGFIYDYVLRGGFLDGREGLLLHLNHAACVSWKYTKAWELSREKARREQAGAEF
jgi:glycosyltransferase involved in cell wall biosynthesis